MNFNDQILNQGLSCALEFGPALNQPIHQRLLTHFPHLANSELDTINRMSYEVRDEGHTYLLSVLKEVAHHQQTLTTLEITLIFYSYLLSKYLWINEKNLEHLFSQSCYYAYKDGLMEAIKD